MDIGCKKAFLIVFGLPAILFLSFAWIFLGGEQIQGGWFNGFFDNLSLMWLPTILFLIVGWIVDKFLFNGSLLNCLKSKSVEK